MKYNYDYELYPLKDGNTENVKVQIEAEETFRAPLEANTEIGKIHVIIDNKEIMTISIVTTKTIERTETWAYFFEIIAQYTKQLEKVMYRLIV